ncbi:hypothetical protein [Bradyrhizobium sp. SYSU BS000235]|uniref:hypothetical protein n=1 Tax=Bradyrhizobium sp. SYSU BS000235 TaxID=3411332 RepID=UPI003C77C74C
MALFSGKRLVWQAFAAGVVISASLAAQPAMAADDLPVVDDMGGPPPIEDEVAPPPRYYAPAPHVQRPYAPEVYERDSYAPPPIRVERTGLYPRPVLPPYQVATIVRSSGYIPLGPVARRGWVYTMAAAGPRGIEGRLVIDARTGRIMRFAPALAVGDAMAYGPPPGRPLYQQDYRRAPRPPAPVPHVAKGNVHGGTPKVASQSPSAPAPTPSATSSESSGAAKTAATSAAQHPAGSPAAERPAAVAPLDKTAEAKPAATVGAVAQPPAAAPTASTLKLWPTQAMPPVQPLD